MNTNYKQIRESRLTPIKTEYENNILIWEALEKLAQAIDNIIQKEESEG